MAFVLDPQAAFGDRAARRLAADKLAWLVTVSPNGTPQPTRVWFLFEPDPASFLLYSRPDTPKLRNIAANPSAALHLDGDDQGGSVVIVTAAAAISDDPPANEVAAYAAKYQALIAKNGWTAASFAADYSVPIRLSPRTLRGW